MTTHVKFFILAIIFYALLTSCTIEQWRTPASASAGDRVTGRMLIKNGYDNAAGGLIPIGISVDSEFNPSDWQLGSVEVRKLPAGASRWYQSTFTIPANLNSGQYYLVCATDADNALNPITIKGADGANVDLAGINFHPAGTATIHIGDRFDFTFAIRNLGSYRSGNFTYTLSLSTDRHLDESDTQLAKSTTSIAGKTTKTFAGWVQLLNTPSDEMYLIVSVDANNRVREIAKQNNDISKFLRIRGRQGIDASEPPIASLKEMSTEFATTEKVSLDHPITMQSDDKVNANSPTFEVYPNPTVDHVQIDSPINSKLIIYDTAGQTRLVTDIKEGINRINVLPLESGFYFLTIRTQQGVYTKKIIKK